jgi:hypothetical protein
MAAKLGKKAVSSLVQLDLSLDVFWKGFWAQKLENE